MTQECSPSAVRVPVISSTYHRHLRVRALAQQHLGERFAPVQQPERLGGGSLNYFEVDGHLRDFSRCNRSLPRKMIEKYRFVTELSESGLRELDILRGQMRGVPQF